MVATMDEILQSLHELNETIREHRTDPATVDQDVLKAALEPIMADLRAEQAPLLRRGLEVEQAPLGGGLRAGAVIRIAGNKFDGMKVSDVYMVKRMIEAARMFNPQAPGPSPALLKAMDSTTGGSGDELVPTLLAAELWPEFYLMSKILPAFGGLLPMPSDPWDIPLWSTFTWYKGTQNTATTASNPTTAKSTMTTTELLAEVDWSYTLDEDSIIAMMPSLRAELVRSGAEKMDAFMLNADATNTGTGNINLDDADPPDTSYYLSAGQDGLRHQWLVDNTAMGVNAGGDALADGDILDAMALMGKYAVTPSDTVMIADVSTYINGLLNLDGVQTLDKYGPAAVLLSGELAKYRGIPIIVSESAPLTEADGKVSTTPGNNTLGQLTIANRLAWKAGTRRDLLIEVDRDIQKRQMIMVASFRLAVAARTRASATHTAGVRNILVA